MFPFAFLSSTVKKFAEQMSFLQNKIGGGGIWKDAIRQIQVCMRRERKWLGGRELRGSEGWSRRFKRKR